MGVKMPLQVLELAKKIREENHHGFFSFSDPVAMDFRFNANDNSQNTLVNDLLIAALNAKKQTQPALNPDVINNKLKAFQEVQVLLRDFDSKINDSADKINRLEQRIIRENATHAQLISTANDLKTRIVNANNTANLARMQAEVVLIQEDAREILEGIETLQNSLTLQKTTHARVEKAREDYRTANAQVVAEYEEFMKDMNEIQNIIATTYLQAQIKDQELLDIATRLKISLGVASSVAVLGVLAFFLPEIVAGTLAVIVGLIPAIVVLIIGITLLFTAAFSGAPGTGEALGLTVLLGLAAGIASYSLFLVAMPYVAIVSAIASVGSAVASLVFGIQHVSVNSEVDEYFEQTFTEEFEKQNLSTTPARQSGASVTPVSLFAARTTSLIDDRDVSSVQYR